MAEQELINAIMWQKRSFDPNGIFEALCSLTPIEEFILRSRFAINCEKKTLQEMGERLGVTGERIRSIQEKAIRKMRHPTRQKIFVL